MLYNKNALNRSLVGPEFKKCGGPDVRTLSPSVEAQREVDYKCRTQNNGAELTLH
jgi:hypothetical protein